MIKFATIFVLLATGLQCRVIPDDDSAPISTEEKTIDKSDISLEERTIEKSDISQEERTVNTDSTNSAQESSKEATTEDTSKSDTSEAKEEPSAAESITSERHERSTDESRKEGKKYETRSANIDNANAATRTSSPDKSKETSRSGSECATCSNLRNSKSNTNDPTQARSDKAPDLKSGTIQTETSERDDASHINIKESRQAPEDGNMEMSSLPSASEEHSKTAPVENENSKTAPIESKDASQQPQSKTENQEDERSAEDDAKSALLTDVGVQALVNSDLEAEISPKTSLRIFHQKPHLRDGTPESSETAADTRMAPREDSTPSGLQVNSFGPKDSGQSDYPYSPLESIIPDIQPVLPSLSNLLSRTIPMGKSFTTPQNFNVKFPSNSPLEGNKPFRLLPPLPQLEQNDGFKLLPPLPSLEPFKPLPPIRPLESTKPFEPLSPPRYIQGNGQFEPKRFLPPLEHFPPFRPLPPLRQSSNRAFEPLPPLPPLEPVGPFKTLPQFRPLEHNEKIEPQTPPDQSNVIKLMQQLQQQQFQQSPHNLFSTFPLHPFHSKPTLTTFRPSPNRFSLFRQSTPESLSQTFDSMSRTWHAALSSPTTAMSFSRTVEYQ